MTAPQPPARKGTLWASISADAWKHPKFEHLLDEGRLDAIGAWAMLLSWSSWNWRDDGFISRRKAAAIGLTDDPADALIGVGLIELVDDERGVGYCVHNWTKWNRSAADIEADKAAEAQRKADARAARTGRRKPKRPSTSECPPDVHPDISATVGGQKVPDADASVNPLRGYTDAAQDAPPTPDRVGDAARPDESSPCTTCGLTGASHYFAILKGTQPAHQYDQPADPPEAQPPDTDAPADGPVSAVPPITSPVDFEAERQRQLAGLAVMTASHDATQRASPLPSARRPAKTPDRRPQ